MSRQLTDSERRLKAYFQILEDTKAGRRPFKTTVAEQQVLQQPVVTVTGGTSVPSISASGQKLPSKIRLKQTNKQSQQSQPSSTPPQSPRPLAGVQQPLQAAAAAFAPGTGTGPASSSSAAAAAAAAATHKETPGEAEAVKPTISRDKLAALLKQKQLLQQQQQPSQTAQQQQQQLPPRAGLAAAAKPAASAPAQLAPVRTQKAPSRARVPPLPAAPSTPGAAPAAAGMSVDTQQQQQQRQPQLTTPGASRPPAAAAKAMDIDYDAVSSPEYEVDYDAVSSPEYEPGVSDNSPQKQKQKQGRHVAAADAPAGADDAPGTPECRQGQQMPFKDSTAAQGSSPPVTPHNKQHPYPLRPSDRRQPEAGKPRSRSRSRSRGRSSRGSYGRQHSTSGSPAVRNECRRSRSSSPQRSSKGIGSSSPRRSHGRSRSRSKERSRSRAQHGHRSRSRSRGRDHGRGGSCQRGDRSRSRSRSRLWGYGSRRRSSPDYGLGSRGAGPMSRSGSLGQRGVAEQDEEEGELAGAAEDDSAACEEGQPRSRRQQQQPRGRQAKQKQQLPTLFVGDLPPVGFTSQDLQGLFSAFGWQVVGARVMGSQCYGFVEFASQQEAEQALELVQDRDPGFSINGAPIRASWAKGSMPSWKQGKAVLSKREREQGLEGLEAYEHPTARLLRLQTAAAMMAAAQGVKDLDAVGGVAVGQQQHGAQAAPASRQIIDYGDL